jgi:hypothetical protein
VTYLYQIRLPDGRGYIGVAKRPCVRFTEHSRSGYEIGRAIRKAGKANVSFRVLACGDEEYIYDLEERAVAAFGTRWPSGLNVATGGFGGHEDMLPEVREKCRRAVLGLRRSAETRAKMAAWPRKPMSAQTKAKLAAVNLGKHQSPELVEKRIAPLRGRSKSMEHCAKISAGLTGKVRSLESRQKQSATRKGHPWSEARRAAYDPVKALAAQKRATEAPRSAETLLRLREARKRQIKVRNTWGQWSAHGV